MSSIVASFGAPTRLPTAALLERMAAAMSLRGSDTSGSYWNREAGVVMTANRYLWELGSDFSGPVHTLYDADVAIAADATLYYRADLLEALAKRGVRVTGSTPSHLIVAAYRAWGDRCPEHLEGDYAFALWDARTGTVLCSRSHSGHRPLYFAQLGNTLLVASSMGALVAHPECPAELNLAALGDDVAGVNGSFSETVYRAIERLPAGWSFSWKEGSRARTWRHWAPPPFADFTPGATGFREAAEELRAILVRAVGERLSPSHPASVWLSGGRDSSAVFGAGKQYLRETGSSTPLLATSVSYPEGDPGREDELIESITAFWGEAVRWVDATKVRLFEGIEARGVVRDEPYPHPFESLLRSLAHLDREAGVRISLDGAGGDQLFTAPDSFYGDLLFSGRWLRLYREWRKYPWQSMGSFWRTAVYPSVPARVQRAITSFRGGRRIPGGSWEREIPSWVDPEFNSRHELRRREHVHVEKRGRRSHAAYHAYWTLTAPRFSQLNAYLAGYSLAAGAEHRSPFYDQRLIAFAASRPRSDRNFAGDTKRLLRAASRTLVPDDVLHSRRVKTGRAHGYLGSETRNGYPAVMTLLLQDAVLAELGIVDPDAIRQTWELYVKEDRHVLAAQLGVAVEVEAWLRARNSVPESGLLADQRRHTAA
jgi:asparagine synthase (glutamine-hydrolysing)